MKLLVLVFLMSWTIMSIHAQSTKTLDGVQYTIIDPVTYSFNADTGKIKVGEMYFIEGQVTMTSGASLYINDISVKTSFILNSPMKLNYGTNVTMYVKITEANQYSIEATIIKLDGPGIPASPTVSTTTTKSMDNVQYTIIDPVTYSFNADSGKVKVGETYVIEGKVTMISGASLYMEDISVKTSFILNSPMKLNYGTKVTVYVKITEANQYSIKATIVKIVT